MSEARPDSNSANTVDDKCLPILSAAKNIYRGFLNCSQSSGEIFAIHSLFIAIWLIILVSIIFLGYCNSGSSA
jgi:hypothetical protein